MTKWVQAICCCVGLTAKIEEESEEYADNNRNNNSDDHVNVIPGELSGNQEVTHVGTDVVDAAHHPTSSPSIRNVIATSSTSLLTNNNLPNENNQSRKNSSLNSRNANNSSNNTSYSVPHINNNRLPSVHHDKNPSTSSEGSSSYEPYMTLSECHTGIPVTRSHFGHQVAQPPRPPKPQTLGRRSKSKSESSSSSLNEEEPRHLNTRVPPPSSSSLLPTIPAGDPGAYDMPKNNTVQLRDKGHSTSAKLQTANYDFPRSASEMRQLQHLNHGKLVTHPGGDLGTYDVPRLTGEKVHSSTLKPKSSSSSSVPVSPVKILPPPRVTNGMIGPDQMYDFPKFNSSTLPHVSHTRSASDSKRRIVVSESNDDLNRQVPVPELSALNIDPVTGNPIGRHNYTNSAPGFFQNKESMLVYEYNPTLEDSNHNDGNRNPLPESAPPRPPKPDKLGKNSRQNKNKQVSEVKQRSQSGSSLPHNHSLENELNYLDVEQMTFTESDASSPRTPNMDTISHRDSLRGSGRGGSNHSTPHKMMSGNRSHSSSAFNSKSSLHPSRPKYQLDPPPPRSTVYKTVDFVKTNALSKTKAIVEGGK